MKILKPEDAAYIAGLVDGEGSIAGHKQMRRGGRPSYRLSVSIVNTDEAVIKWIGEVTGLGCISETHSERHRSVWRWCVCQHDGVKFLNIIRPFLRIKGGQADAYMDLHMEIQKYAVAIQKVCNKGRRLPYEVELARDRAIARLSWSNNLRRHNLVNLLPEAWL